MHYGEDKEFHCVCGIKGASITLNCVESMEENKLSVSENFVKGGIRKVSPGTESQATSDLHKANVSKSKTNSKWVFCLIEHLGAEI